MGKKTMLLIFVFTFNGLLTFDAVAGQTTTKAPEVDIDLGPANFKCPNGTYVAPHETRCELYYICGEGSTTHMYQCRNNYLFSLKYNGCDFAEYTDCGSRLPPFTCPSTNGDYPIKAGACDSRYFTCVNGVSTLKTCPNGGLFNPATSTCAAPGAITCPTSTTPRLPTAPGPFECPPKTEGNVPSPYTCTQYYSCTNDATFLFECPAGLYYDRYRDLCDYPENVPYCFERK